METVQLGDQSFVLVPQKRSRLQNRLGGLFDSLGDSDVTNGGDLMSLLADKGFEVLEVFLGRDFMPKWKWDGYASPDHAERGEYVEELALDPDVPQIIAAIKAAASVNGLDSFRALGNVVSPELIRAVLTANLTEVVADSMRRRSQTSASPSGESASTPSTANGSTSPEDIEGAESPATSPALTASPSSD